MSANREDYNCANGIAAWWIKDGAWHIAVEPKLIWSDVGYDTREEAIAALESK